jgi:signal transduction histidine kinase
MEPVFRDVDVSAMFAQVIQERGGNPQTFIEPNMHVSGDERLLHLVGQNLVDNSIKFVRPGVRAHIEIFTEGDEVVYRDQGIGFDQRYVDKIWLPFQRLVSDEAFAGTGVGLANVRRIIERHGGTIRAEGVLGEGSTFWIKLPRRAPTAA